MKGTDLLRGHHLVGEVELNGLSRMGQALFIFEWQGQSDLSAVTIYLPLGSILRGTVNSANFASILWFSMSRGSRSWRVRTADTLNGSCAWPLERADGMALVESSG